MMHKTVKIGPIAYALVEVGDLHSGGVELDGQVRHCLSEIRIERDQEEQSKTQTLWHEIVHIILNQAGRREDSKNEDLVEALAYGLMGVIQDNPWLATGGSDGGEDAG